MAAQVYTRLDRTKVHIFDHIFVITNLYRSDSSWGFLCAMTDVPIAREKLMKSPQFCRDLPAGEATHQRSERNQERACFRGFSGIGHRSASDSQREDQAVLVPGCGELEQIIEDSLTKALLTALLSVSGDGGQVLGPECRLARLCGPCARLTESSSG